MSSLTQTLTFYRNIIYYIYGYDLLGNLKKKINIYIYILEIS